MFNRAKRLAFLSLPCIAGLCLIASAPAAFADEELKVVEHATTDVVTDTGEKGDTVGDILTFANEVFDADDKEKIGTDQGVCFSAL